MYVYVLIAQQYALMVVRYLYDNLSTRKIDWRSSAGAYKRPYIFTLWKYISAILTEIALKPNYVICNSVGEFQPTVRH